MTTGLTHTHTGLPHTYTLPSPSLVGQVSGDVDELFTSLSRVRHRCHGNPGCVFLKVALCISVQVADCVTL